MEDYFEVDFLAVNSAKSCDAITIRYRIMGETTIHVVDGGFQDSGELIVSFINEYYSSPSFINRVIVTHPDGDHTGGLRSVLEKFEVGELWMLRPWLYAEELIDRFSRFTSVVNLENRLREIYPNIFALEKIADEKGIPIMEPFQGAALGEFMVFAPTKSRFLDLVLESEKTPEAVKEESSLQESITSAFGVLVKSVTRFLRAVWGEERFSEDPTSAENEMSVIQYAKLCDKKNLLTGDAGREALKEAADYALQAGLVLPGIDNFQAPHHGSRRNLSTDLLDRWVGPRLPAQLEIGSELFTSIISAADKDEDHPRKAVIRALHHRGAEVLTPKKTSLRISQNAPDRPGWVRAIGLDYPSEQEE